MNQTFLEPMAWVFDAMSERELWSFDMRLSHWNTPVGVTMYALPNSFVDEDFTVIHMAGAAQFSAHLLHKLGFNAEANADMAADWWCSVLELEWLPVVDDSDERSGHINRVWVWLGYNEDEAVCEYRMLWTERELTSCVAMMVVAEVLDEQLLPFKQQAVVADIATILAAAVEFLGKSATDFTQWQQPSKLLPPTTPDDFVALLQLLNPNTNMPILAQAAADLYQRLVVGGGDNEGDLAEYLFHENCFSHDWKFDAEDLAEVIAELLGQETFVLAAPEDTFGDGLFDSAQAALSPLSLRLMNYQTFGDNYVFFLLPDYQVATVLLLSQKTGCDLELLAS